MSVNYPVQYIKPVQLSDGSLVQLRPIHPQDGQQASSFKQSLSAKSIVARFLGYIPTISKELTKQLVEIDYTKEMAIIAEIIENKRKKLIGVGRISSTAETPKTVEFSVIISEKWQGKRLGNIMLRYLLEIAKDMGFKTVEALVFSTNVRMLEILRQHGFEFEKIDEDTVRASRKV